MASNRVSVEVQGLQEALKQVDRLIGAMEPRKVERVMLGGARLIAKDAKARAPKKDGNLRRGIRAKIGKRRGKSFASAFAAVDRKWAPHAHLVEYGHLMVVGGKLNKGGRVVGIVPPHPFWRPAVESQRRPVAIQVTEGLRALLRQKGWSA